MTSKTRMIAALAGKPTDHLPVAPLYLDLYLDREVRRRALAGYLEKMGDRLEVDMQPEWELQVQAKAVEETFTALQARPDWICWMTQLPPTAWLSDCALKRQNGKLWRIHRPSGEMEELSSVEPIFEEMSDLWNLPAPRDDQEINRRVPLLTHEEIVQSGALDLLARLLMDLGEEYFVCAGMSTAFTACYFLLGFQSLMTMPYEDENLFRYLLERVEANILVQAEAFLHLGVHGIFIEESFTSADLISPNFYDSFVFPSDQKLLRRIRAAGRPSILYVTGDILPRLPRFLELGPTALAVEESKKNFTIELAEVAQKVGKQLVLFGNIDATQIKTWSDQELMLEVKRQHSSSIPALGFVCSLGSPLPLDTPIERLEAFVRIAKSFPVDDKQDPRIHQTELK